MDQGVRRVGNPLLPLVEIQTDVEGTKSPDSR